jgi:hypothetical protein
LFFSRTARYWYFSFGCLFFLLFLFFFIRVYSSFFLSLYFRWLFWIYMRRAGEGGGLSVARLMTRAPSDNTRTAKIVLNVTKQGERERKNHTTNISRPRKEREREKGIFSWFRPFVGWKPGPVEAAPPGEATCDGWVGV